MKKGIITVLGKDTVGIIANVCTCLAKDNINILDISQTIVSGMFNMMMIVDLSNTEDTKKIAKQLAAIGDDLGVKVQLQREEIFDSMHRI